MLFEVFRLCRHYKEYDPASSNYIETFLCYPWLKSIFFHRIAHFLYRLRVPILPRIISEFSRWLTGIEVHPGARIGFPVFVDHGMGVVIGETAEIADHVLIYQGVTLGGTERHKGKRHPTIKHGVIVGAGAKILGPVVIGENARIGSNAIVISDVEADHTVVSPLPRVINRPLKIDITPLHHQILIDPIMNQIDELKNEVNKLREVVGAGAKPK